MQSRLLKYGLLACLLAAAVMPGQAEQASEELSSDDQLTVERVLGGASDEGFARALAPRDFVFPPDHGPHPEFRTEWWYYTGNLVAENSRRFGYQLTFFRTALTPQPPDRDSNWATNQVYMAHLALTDVGRQNFHHFERFSRGSLGLAGAKAEPFQVWLEDWSATGGPGEPFTMKLKAQQDGVAIELLLESLKPVVLQGQNGLSQKSASPGNASYYYSMTRLQTSGVVQVAGESFQVNGTSWLDREWSTSALGEDQVGWDWFSLQLDDQRELMYYQLRLRDGRPDPMSSGVLVGAAGATRRLKPENIEISVLEHWQSETSGAKYPAKWRIDLLEEKLSLEISPLVSDQELQTTIRYWEGAVAVQGKQENTQVTGHGYVEMTGY